MTPFTITLPTDAEEGLIRRFTVNRNYLAATANFLGETYGRGVDLYGPLHTTVRAHPPYKRIKRGDADLDEVRRFLILGWASEIQLHLPSRIGSEAAIGFANAWAPVHAYYAMFGLLQAWYQANKIVGTADDHTATLKTIAAMIEERHLFPQPWDVLAVGWHEDRNYLNADGRDCAGTVSALSTPPPLGSDPTFWPRFGTWLRRTRKAILESREAKWKRRERVKRIPPDERIKIAGDTAPTSLFDCIWRMRVKSNYGTIDPYLVSQIEASDHQIFNEALCTLTRATVGLLELYVAARIGAPAYRDIAAEFVRQDRANVTAETLGARCAGFGINLS